MPKYSHDFIEEYDELIAFGLDRQNDELAVKAYLQMFGDDACSSVMTSRMSAEELTGLFDMISDLLRRHLSEEEYHNLFLKEEHHH